MTFKDHFSEQSDHYRQYRPTYPDALFTWLASITPEHDLAWDCATGSGQSASRLTEHFKKVIATDASAQQIEQAITHPGVDYQVAPAEQTSIADSSVNLVTVAQALHWFDVEAFFSEVDRVLKPGGLLAIWSYKLLNITPAIDEAINHLYSTTLDGYWPKERQWIEEEYQSFNFPYREIEAPEFTMDVDWNLRQLLGYLGTWSAIKRYLKENGENPLEDLAQSLLQIWGDPESTRQVSWPLILKVRIKPK